MKSDCIEARLTGGGTLVVSHVKGNGFRASVHYTMANIDPLYGPYFDSVLNAVDGLDNMLGGMRNGRSKR